MTATYNHALQPSIKQLEEENELLLLQLHQVQEELEHYFLLNQENEKKLSVNGQPASAVQPVNVSPVIVISKTNWFYTLTDRLGWTIRGQIQSLKESGAFDEAWYLNQYPDVAQAGKDPIEHYLRYGAGEGRNPSPYFDSQWYLQHYPDVVEGSMNPLLHYVRFGREEGRKPSWNQLAGADINPYARTVEDLLKKNADRQGQIEQLNRDLKRAQAEIESLKQTKSQLEQDKAALAARHDVQAMLAAERQAQLERAQAALSALEQDKKALEGHSAELAHRVHVLEQARDAQAAQAEERRKQMEALTREREDQARHAAERQAEIESLKQTKAQLEQDKAALAARYNEQAKLAGERQAQLVRAQAALSTLEQDKNALEGHSAELAQTVHVLEQARDAQAAKAEERRKRTEELQQQIQSRQAGEAELASRQQFINDEMVRAEAQLDLIKDMLLREPSI